MSSGQSIPQKMKQKVGLESQSTESSMESKGSSMKEAMGKKMDQMKETMGVNK